MADVIITPASGLIDFQNTSGISSATIQLNGSGDLIIGAAAGDIQIGDTSSDVYIGDGVNNVDIVFEQDGEVRGETGVTVTLGQSDSFIAFAGDVTGDVTFTGKLVFPDNATVPDNPTNEQYDYMTFGANGSISQVSGRGALMIASSDDALILANGDVGRTFTSSNIDVDIENIFLLSDANVTVKTDLQSGFGSENTYTFAGGVITSPRFTSTQATGTAPFTVSSTTVVTNLNADTVDGIQASSFLRSDAADTATGLLTLSGGINVTGVSTFQGNVNLGDNDKLILGDDGDLRIYHDGTSSVVVDLAGGGLYLSGSSSVIISDEAGVETLASFTKGGSAELYYADEKKLETATSGINVVGTTTTGQLSVTGVSTFQGGIHDGTSLGTSGQVLSSTGTGLSWIDAAAGGGGGGGGGEFNTGITSSIQITPLSYETTVHTFPSTSGEQYIIESINIANIDTSVGVGTTINIITSIEDSSGEQTYIAYNVPIVNGGLIELLKNPIVAGPSDVIKMWTTNNSYIGVNNAAEVYMNYTQSTSSEYVSVYASTVSIATTDITTVYTSTTYPTVFESIHLANRSDIGDYPVSVLITNGVTTTYLAKDLIIPRYSTVDILDRPKRIDTNGTIKIKVEQTSTIDVIISGKQITS